MKRQCYYINPTQDISDYGGFTPSLVTEGEPGHQPMTGDPAKFQAPWVWGKTLAQAEEIANTENEKRGLTKEDCFKIVLSSMRF